MPTDWRSLCTGSRLEREGDEGYPLGDLRS